MFEKIMEAKIKKWNEEKSKPDYTPPPPIKSTFGKPLEQSLLEQIEELIIKASKKDEIIEKEKLLKKVANLEIELLMSYENQGFYLLAQKTQGRIQKYKSEYLNKNIN